MKTLIDNALTIALILLVALVAGAYGLIRAYRVRKNKQELETKRWL